MKELNQLTQTAQQTKIFEGGRAMKRGEFSYAVESKSELPRNAKEMKLILHIIRKEDWDRWNELKVYDFGSDEEVFIVSDRNYLRVPDPGERYYFYFYTEHENGETQWHYVKIEKGTTSMKGFLTWDKVRDKILSYRDGIYDVIHVSEEGKKLLGLPEFRLGEVEFLYERNVLNRKRVIEDENAHILLFEDTTVSKIDDNLCLLKPCKTLNVIIIKRREGFIFPINKNGFYSAEISYELVDFVHVYEIKRDIDNIVLKEYLPDKTVRLISIN